MKLNRTQNAKNNVLWGGVAKGVTLLFPFVVRMVLIKTLGIDYLGLNGLFTAMLGLLNITELGVGIAIVYSMYKPIADDDTSLICALMNFYKKVYRVIGVVILILGLSLMPFLSSFVKGATPAGIDLHILYLIYLSNSVLSYWLFAYKNCLLTAHQRSDVSTKVQIFTTVLMYISQIIVLFTFSNFYVYAVMFPLFSIAANVITAHFASKMFSQYKAIGQIDRKQLHHITKQVVGLLTSKVAFISRSTIGNVVVSATLGLSLLGIYSNYFYICSAITGCMFVFTISISAGIGNSIAMDSKEKNEHDMRVMNFLYMSVSYVCYCCLLVLFQPFMKLWLGEDFLLPDMAMISFAIFFLVEKEDSIIGQYYDSAGLWWHGKWKGFIETIFNLCFVIVGCKIGNVTGIMMAGSLVLLFVGLPLTAYYVYRFYYKKSFVLFFMQILLQLFVFAVTGLAVYSLCNFIQFSNSILLEILLKLALCIILSVAFYYLIMHRTAQYKESFIWLKKHIRSLK